MTFPFWCLLAVLVIPTVLTGVGSYFKAKQFGSYDNEAPREQAALLEGAGARAWAAQQNAWEAIALFTPAVLVAHVAGADPGSSALASGIFVIGRILHAVFYIAGMGTLRSLAFLVCFASVVWLFVLAANA